MPPADSYIRISWRVLTGYGSPGRRTPTLSWPMRWVSEKPYRPLLLSTPCGERYEISLSGCLPTPSGYLDIYLISLGIWIFTYFLWVSGYLPTLSGLLDIYLIFLGVW